MPQYPLASYSFLHLDINKVVSLKQIFTVSQMRTQNLLPVLLLFVLYKNIVRRF